MGQVCGRCHAQTQEYFQQSVHAQFPNFPVCVGCHSPNPDLRDHDIGAVTRGPEALSKAYKPLAAGLMDRGARPAAIAEALRAAILRDDRKAPVRLGEICQRCHVVGSLRGHRPFFEDVDREAAARGVQLDEMVREATVWYVQTSVRVDRVGRGVLLVEREAVALEDARTHLIRLAAEQHTLDPARVTETAETLSSVCKDIEAALDAKEAGLRWRYRSLGGLWAFLGVFISALWIKYKRLKKAYVVPRELREGVPL